MIYSKFNGYICFEAGKLPPGNGVRWRKDSALRDGQDIGVDLSGGLYDAGDHIKFSLPMSFTSTLLSWAALEYADPLHKAQLLDRIVFNIQWITDYLIKTHPSSQELYFQVGDPLTDHSCWERAEDIEIARPSLKLNSSMPGAEVAAEVAAAMASASMVFRKLNASYSNVLLNHAKDLFVFADTWRGSYISSYPDEEVYYNSTGFGDELLWAASWLFYATGDVSYLNYVTGNTGQLYAEWGKAPAWLSWDNKVPGVQILLARHQLLEPQLASSQGYDGLENYTSTAHDLICAFIPDSPSATKSRTKGGLLWISEWNSLQHAVNAAFLSLLYSDYLFTTDIEISCSGQIYTYRDIRNIALSQADYILGNNPMSMSYLVGYGNNYPQKVHHRGASIPMDSIPYNCKRGFVWLSNHAANPNVAVGALVGGPFQNDTFIDERNNAMQNEPTTYNSAAMAALMAGLSAGKPVIVPSWVTR